MTHFELCRRLGDVLTALEVARMTEDWEAERGAENRLSDLAREIFREGTPEERAAARRFE